MKLRPLAGKLAEPSVLVNVPRLVTAYYAERPEQSMASTCRKCATRNGVTRTEMCHEQA